MVCQLPRRPLFTFSAVKAVKPAWFSVATMLATIGCSTQTPAAETPSASVPAATSEAVGASTDQSSPAADPSTTAASGGTFALVSSVEETHVYRLDASAGSLSPAGKFEGAEYWAAAPGGTNLYGIVTADDTVKVIAASLDGQGTMTKINESPIAGAVGATHLAVHPSGRWVLAAHTNSGQASVLPIDSSGAVGAPVELTDNGPKSHYIMADQAGKYVFVPSLEGHYVGQFSIDSETGRLTPNTPPRSAEVMNARHMDFHPSQAYAYVVGAAASIITSFKYDPATGVLTDPQTLPTVPADSESKSGAAHVAVHPSGKFVYASNRDHHSIAIFAIDASTGRLTLVGYEQADGQIMRPRDFAIDPTGNFLLIANKRGTGTALLMRIDQANGKLSLAQNLVSPPVGMYAGFVSQ